MKEKATMRLRGRNRFSLLAFFLLIVPCVLFAQPYLYYPQEFGEEDDRNIDIYRVNLQTGGTEMVVHNVGKVLKVFWDRGQSNLFLQSRGSLDVIQLLNANQRRMLVDNVRFADVLDVFDSPATNRIYVSVGSEDGAYERTIVFNRSTYDTVAILDEFMSFHRPFLSVDEQKFYRFVPDSTGIFFDIYESSSGRIILENKRCGDLGYFAYLSDFSEGRSGVGIVRIRLQKKDNWRSEQYVVCHPREGSVSAIIPFPLRSEAHLSGDARFVIIERVNFERARPSAEYRPGNIWVFESSTGKLTQRLTLPPEGRILVFDNYPDKFFYYIEEDSVPRSLTINLTTITPGNILLDTLIALSQQAFSEKQLGDQRFVQELDRDLQRAKTKLAKNDTIGCAQELEEFQGDVKKEYLAKPTKNDKRFVSEEGYKTLYFNAHYIVDRVITRPPRSYAPLLDQLTALRTEIRADALSGFLGGEILLKGLEAMVDGAKLRLQRRDSLGTALYLTLFRQTVRQTYELTKNRTIGKIYVKPEGYVSLYYRAGYILEALPEPTGLLLPKMERELEQELQSYQRQVEQQN